MKLHAHHWKCFTRVLLGILVLLSACSGTSGKTDDTPKVNHRTNIEHPGYVDRGAPRDDHFSEQNGADLSSEEPVSLYVYMDNKDLTELFARDVFSDDLLPARVHVSKGLPELDVRGLRFRGSGSRRYARRGFNIRLDSRPALEDFPTFNFRSESRRAGNRIIVNAMWTDPSAMREALSFGMYRTLGLAASQTFYSNIYFNDIFEGLFVGIERVDREALRGWGLNRTEGEFTLVRDESKAHRNHAEISNRSIFGFDIDSILYSDEARQELLHEIFSYRGEVEDQDWAGLLELIRWVHNTPAGSQYAREFEERFDVDQVIDFLAIHSLTHDRDSLDIDFWLYRDHSEGADDGRWKLIPWDKNLTFGAHYYNGYQGQNNFFDYDYDALNTMGNAIVVKFLATARLREKLHTRMTELMQSIFTVDYFKTQIQGYRAQIAASMARMPGDDAFVVHPQQHHGELGQWLYHLNSLIDFVELRWQYLERYVNPKDGERYRAQLTIENGAEGDVFFLTDAGGWVIARLKLDEPLSHAALSISVDQEGGLDGVDRIWSVDTGDDVIKGELSLYYRNTPSQNWYVEEVAAGKQWDLSISVRVEDGWQIVSSQVNPFSNRVRAHVELRGDTQFALLHR